MKKRCFHRLKTYLRHHLVPFLYSMSPHLAYLIPVLLILLSETVFARVGGGQRYSGGRGSGDGDGIGFLIYLLIRLCIQQPLIGIPVIIAVAIFFYYSSKKANTYNQGRVIRKGRQWQEEHAHSSAISQLKQRDPDFDEQVFLNRVRAAFLRLQEAWCNQDMSPTRHFLSDAVFERFTLQINTLKDQGVRDHMQDITVLAMDIVQLQSDEVFDTVTVRIRARAVDYRVSLKTGKYVEGSKSPETFTEYWSFVRRPGAKTLTGNGLMEGNCPNCGDSLALNESAQCESCGSLIKSGEYDWVLAEITQASEWQVAETVDIPGVDLIRQSDPGFSVQHIEDRVSVMFWRLMETYRTGQIDPLRKIASNEFCETLAKTDLKPNEQGERVIPDDVAVGSVESLGTVLGEEWDNVLVQVRWSAMKIVLDAKGRRKKGAAGASVYTHVYITKRQHGVKSDLSKALSSGHCPNCGAPAGESTSDSCDYCGTVLNTGAQDWVLDGIEISASARVRELRAQFGRAASTRASGASVPPPPPSGTSGVTSPLLPGDGISGGLEASAWMINVMLADGKIDPKEQKLIYDYTAARGIPKHQAEQLLAQATRQGKLEAPEPRTKTEAQTWLVAMTKMALADGFIAKEEQHMLLQMGKKLGFSGYDIKQLIAKTRKQMYKEAKTNLRQKK